MKRFIAIFKKVGGWDVLKQYARAHVLLYALAQTLLCGFSKKGLEIVRLAVNNRIYNKVRKKYRRFITEYTQNNPAQSFCQKHNPIIWTIWLQGMDQAPKIVQQCYASMCKHITDRPIVVITEDNFREYVTFPAYIMEKYQKGMISKVHFADLLRVELLTQHGGTWLDGTVFCSDQPFQPYVLDSELFLFQNLKPGLDGQCRRVSSWLMTAHANNPIMQLTRALLHEYWRTHNYAVDYFILHNFIEMAIEAYPQVWEKVVPFSNSTPHILLLRLFDRFDSQVWEGVRHHTSFHKLSYKFAPEQTLLPQTYYTEVLGQYE